MLHLCVSVVHLVGLDGLAAGLATVVDHHVELGPGPELPLPVGDGGERSDDQERPLDVLHVDLVEECDGLDGLPKTHLVRQNTVSPRGRGIGQGVGQDDDDEDPCISVEHFVFRTVRTTKHYKRGLSDF